MVVFRNRQISWISSMITSQQLRDAFPSESELPSGEIRPAPVHQRQILVGGKLKPWTGKVNTVRSAICVRKADGSLEQVELGSYPAGGLREAEEALAAAVAACVQLLIDDGKMRFEVEESS